MKNNKTFGFIGGGRVTWMLLERLKRQSYLPAKILVNDPDNVALEKVISIAPISIHSADQTQIAQEADLIVLAVHPPQIDVVCHHLTAKMKPEAIILSLIPTVRCSTLQQKLGNFSRIVRMIPNAPSIIGKGYNPVCLAESLSEKDRAFLRVLFEHWGQSHEVPEEHLEAYAIITGMGPTYFWFQWQELQRLAQQFGISEEQSKYAITEMVKGAVDTLYHSGLTADQVLDLIPSYPLKKNEEEIRQIFSDRLMGLWEKLREATR